jgi:hypothetical protein
LSLQPVVDLRLAFMPGLQTDHAPSCEIHHDPRLHGLAFLSVRRRSDEMAALPAVRPARLTAIKPDFMTLPFVQLPLSA